MTGSGSDCTGRTAAAGTTALVARRSLQRANRLFGSPGVQGAGSVPPNRRIGRRAREPAEEPLEWSPGAQPWRRQPLEWSPVAHPVAARAAFVARRTSRGAWHIPDGAPPRQARTPSVVADGRTASSGRRPLGIRHPAGVTHMVGRESPGPSPGARHWRPSRMGQGGTMTVLEKEFTYAPPGMSGSPVPLKERYDNFIGGRWVAPVKGGYSGRPHAGDGQADHRGAAVDRRGRRARPRRRPCRQGRLGRDVHDRAIAGPQRDRRRHRRQPGDARRSPRAGTTASRSARRLPPTSRSRPITSATSRA